jgi:hypothetical protein
MNFQIGYSLFLVGYSSGPHEDGPFTQQKSRPKTAPVENLPTHEIISAKGTLSLYPYAQLLL